MRGLTLLLLPSLAGAQEGGVRIPGLAAHPLDEVGAGAVLVDELRCAACHEGLGEPLPGPDLTDVGGRVSRAYLARFLADPAGTQPGTKMPHGVPTAADAEVLAAFLVGTSSARRAGGVADPALVEQGRTLFHSVGCVACHAPRQAPPGDTRVPAAPEAPGLDHVPAKYDLEGLAAFLFEPLRTRPSGRMPDLALSRGEARALASYLLDGVPPEFLAPPPEQGEVLAGRKRFDELGCASCHTHPAADPAPPRRAAPKGKGAGCLDPAGAGARYDLSTAQRESLGEALGAPAPDAAERLARSLTQLNCISCHERDDYGGVDPELAAYFGTDEPDLGKDASVPPTLTLAGAKLRRDWLSLVLLDGKSVRPYMHTRMPRFGDANVGHLPALFEELDLGQVQPYPWREPERGDEDRAWRDAGRGLLGNQGLACIACHDFNGKPSPTFNGVDLILSPERLRYDWFARFLISPQRYRPGVVMPESWPSGVAAHDGFLEGSTEAQVQAIWHYLRLGRSAADPSGIRVERARLLVEDRVRTYRGRSGVAGFRGVAVGYPGGLSYAFDAYSGALAAIWRGEFVSVNWQSQGAGDFNPIGRPARLARDVAFARLADEEAPWPLLPVTTKEQPVDPGPTYPWDNGYQFLGYHLDDADVPTLRYRTGAVTVQDTSSVLLEGERPVLRRTLTLTAPAAETVYLLLLVGDLERVSPGEVRSPELSLRHPERPALERPRGEGTESLMRLDLTPGTTTLVLDYELLR